MSRPEDFLGLPIPPQGDSDIAPASEKNKSALPLEESIVHTLGIDDLTGINKGLARQVYIIDRIPFRLGLDEEEFVLAYSIWFNADGSYDDIEKLMHKSPQEAKKMIDPVMEDSFLREAYDHSSKVGYILNRVLPIRLGDPEIVKSTIEEIVRLRESGLSDRDIIARLK